MQPELAVMAVRPLLRQHLTLLLNFCALEVFIVGFTAAVPFSVTIMEIFFLSTGLESPFSLWSYKSDMKILRESEPNQQRENAQQDTKCSQVQKHSVMDGKRSVL